MATTIRYVDVTGDTVDWSTIVHSGHLTEDVYRLVDHDGDRRDQLFLFHRAGTAFTTADVAAARADTGAVTPPEPVVLSWPDAVTKPTVASVLVWNGHTFAWVALSALTGGGSVPMTTAYPADTNFPTDTGYPGQG